MPISSNKINALVLEMKRLGLEESDLVERFILGSGPGGQKINKTSSCVYLKHLPTGIEIKCGRNRSRELNRYLARKELCERIKESKQNEISRREAEIEKIRRRKRQRSQRQKQKMLENKHKHSEKKCLRLKPDYE